MIKQINRCIRIICIKFSNTLSFLHCLFWFFIRDSASRLEIVQADIWIKPKLLHLSLIKNKTNWRVIKNGWQNMTNGVRHHHFYNLNIYLFRQFCELKRQFSSFMDPPQWPHTWFPLRVSISYRLNHYILSSVIKKHDFMSKKLQIFFFRET